MRFPIIIVNFKAYKSAVGENALKLAKICDEVASKTGAEIGICVQTAGIYRLSKEVKIPIFAEHVDPSGFGSHTGDNIPEAVFECGAKGTLINHSEKRLRMDVIEKTIKRAKEVGLFTVACANTANEAAAIAEFAPDAIAVEPPELIGGDVSVTTVDPSIVSDTVDKVKGVADIPVLCGAGVKNGKDVRKALELGAKGVLVASGITKSDDPRSALMDMAEHDNPKTD